MAKDKTPKPGELKPCPFCGGKAKAYPHEVQCLNCGIGTPAYNWRSEGVRVWNRRIENEPAASDKPQ